MFALKDLERAVVIFLIFGILLGLGVIAFKKAHSSIDLEIKNFEIGGETASDIDESIDVTRLVDINEAGIEDLMKLKGIGKVIAKRILDYRLRRGRFNSKEDIKNIDGIGDKLFQEIKDYIEL